MGDDEIGRLLNNNNESSAAFVEPDEGAKMGRISTIRDHANSRYNPVVSLEAQQTTRNALQQAKQMADALAWLKKNSAKARFVEIDVTASDDNDDDDAYS